MALGILLFGATFKDTVNLGTGILGALIAIGVIIRLLVTLPTRGANERLKIENESLTRQLGESRNEIADKTRRLNELGAEKDRALQAQAADGASLAELRTQIAAMPRYDDVVKMNTEMRQEIHGLAKAIEQNTEAVRHLATNGHGKESHHA